MVARHAAEVDVLTGGRLRLGVAVGRIHEHYAFLGMRFGDRGRGLEEKVAMLCRFRTEPSINVVGRDP